VRLLEVVHQPRRGGVARVALVLELLAGGSLAGVLGLRGRLRPGEVVTTIAPVAAAVAHAHEHGVVHGDLSPGNIVFTAEGRPVLTDLGVARVLGESAAVEVTPAYVDPTVARGGAPGPASDVFGVAAAAFHALTGIAPWNAATPADILAVAADGYLPDLAELAPDAPPELIAVVNRGLSADPHDRGSAAAFALDLRHACRPEPVRLPLLGGPDDDLATTGRRPRTELTHQVPGLHPRPAPVVVEPGGHRAVWRAAVERWSDAVRTPAARRLVIGVLAVAALALAGLGGVRALGSGTVEAVAPTVVADSSALPESASPEPPATPPRPADRAELPASADEWRAMVGDLYGRRAEAFAAPWAADLGSVYSPASPLRAADAQHARQLASAGEALRGFTPEVVAVTAVDVSGDRAQLDVVDRRPAHEVVAADGTTVRSFPARADTDVRLVLVRTADGWRIESAERRG
jgi:hypothetical protein